MPDDILNVLLVEDDSGDVDLAKLAVSIGNIPFWINSVDDGVKALDYLRKKEPYKDASSPNLVILDLNLPKKNGQEVVAEIKNDPVLRAVPVFVFSTSEIPQDLITKHNLEADHCFIKPLRFENYVSVMRSIEHVYRKHQNNESDSV